MKMYEKMGFDTEAALKWVKDGVENRPCTTCPAFSSISSKDRNNSTCTMCAARFLLSEAPELPKVPRWKTAKTQEDFDGMFADFLEFCNGRLCDNCKYLDVFEIIGNGQKDCYHAYLSELVDAPESEG